MVGLFFLSPANFQLGELPAFGSFSTTVLLLVYAFTGFENAGVPAGEIVNPRRNLPFAILTALAIVTIFYLLIQTVSIGTLPNLGNTERPLAQAAEVFFGRIGAMMIAAGAIISVLGNLNANILTSPRIVFAMSTQRELPSMLSRVHDRFRTPHVSILVTSALVLVLTLQSSLISILTVSTIARLLAYAATCAALPRLRYKQDAPPALLTIPGGIVISGLAIILSLWLLSNSTQKEALQSMIAVAAGFVIYFGYKWTVGGKSQEGERQRREL